MKVDEIINDVGSEGLFDFLAFLNKDFKKDEEQDFNSWDYLKWKRERE